MGDFAYVNSHARCEQTFKWASHLDELREVFSAEVVVGFDEDFAETALSYRVVLGVKLVEPVEGVPVLKASNIFLQS